MNRDAQAFKHPLENRHWNWLEILELILQVRQVTAYFISVYLSAHFN
jgi:hypothetical protein